jgi:hypothetical protein
MSGIIAQNTLDNSGLIKAPAGGGAWNFIKKLTASSSSDLSFVDGTSDVVLDSTYKEYLFTINNIHPSTEARFTFQASSDTGSSYGIAATTTNIQTYHVEDDEYSNLEYNSTHDHAQDTDFLKLSAQTIDDENDSSMSGEIFLFNPSSTTFVKHYIATATHMADNAAGDGHTWTNYTAGYFNTTSAIDAIQFKMSTGNIDAGDICLYGLTT